MSNFKGTQGSWEVSIDQFKNNNIICDGFYLGESRNKYDALLISKSPEMLEMLEKVSIFIKENKGKNYMVELLRREVSEIEQLIKEATEL